jgi:outer membrane lipoprotein-sorting protein
VPKPIPENTPKEVLIKSSGALHWLYQPDARQVFDLPESLIRNSLKVSDLLLQQVADLQKVEGAFRQVGDLPRIRAAKP